MGLTMWTARRTPLPRILDEDNDQLMSEKIRKAEAAERAAKGPDHKRTPRRPSIGMKDKRDDSDFSPFSWEREGS